MYSFGVGTLSATPVTGTACTFGTVQDVTVDISFAEKLLYGEKQFAVDLARGQGKISIKAKSAKITAALFNDLFCGGTAVTSGTTTTATITNSSMGTTPFFALTFTLTYNSKTFTLTFPKCSCSKLGMGFKNEDHTIPEFDITAIDNGSGSVYTLVVTE